MTSDVPDIHDSSHESLPDEDDGWGDSMHVVRDQSGGSTVLPSRREPKNNKVVVIEGVDDEQLSVDGDLASDGQDGDHAVAGEYPKDQPVKKLDIREYKGGKSPAKAENRSDICKAAKKEGQIIKGEKKSKEIESSEWTKKESIKLKWVLPITLGIISIIVCSLWMLPKINEINQRGSAKQVVFRAESIEEIDHVEETEALVKSKDKAASIFGSFLSASDADEVLPLVRNREEVEPLIRQSMSGGVPTVEWDAASSSEWRLISLIGNPSAMLSGVLPDFKKFSAYFVYEDDKLLLDWKATSGYGTATFDELVKGEGDASEVRGVMTPSFFYTDVYPESEYQNYQFVDASGMSLVWCYVKKGTALCDQLQHMFAGGEIVKKEVEPKRVILGMSRPQEGGLPNQWLIERLLREEWVQ